LYVQRMCPCSVSKTLRFILSPVLCSGLWVTNLCMVAAHISVHLALWASHPKTSIQGIRLTLTGLGSTLVHSTGGWAALIGAIILGARKGKYVDGKVNPIPGSNMPLATLGVFILWLGWFGFNGASQLAMGTINDADSIAKVFVNTNMAAVAGVLVAVIYCQLRYGKIDLTLALNGALAGPSVQ